MPVFLEPIWLIVIIPIIAAFLFMPYSSRTSGALRIIFLALVILSLGQMSLQRNQEGGAVVVVADRSLSMPSDASAREMELIRLLSRSAGKNDRMSVVCFGEKSAVEQPLQPAAGVNVSEWTRPVGFDGSELSAALDMARSLIPSDSNGRILLLTDGRYTGSNPLLPAANAAGNVPIDYRMIQTAQSSDISIERLETPESVELGQAFLLVSWINLPAAADISYKLTRGKTVIAQGTKFCPAGSSALTFRDRSTEESVGIGSALSYKLEISSAGKDPIPENNVGRTIVGVRKTRPILHLCKNGQSGLSRILKAGKLEIDSRAPSEVTMDLETMGQYRAVILENVSAVEVTTQGLETLRKWVERSGGAMLMTGGKSSFGLGGYFRSPIEPIMPVSMELRKEHRKLSLALVAVLDRSGSMTMPVAGGQTKMDLANQGVAQTLEILSGQDQLGVIAVDSSSHTVAELQSVENRAALQKKIMSIESMGGGIFIYEGLSSAAAMISKSTALTRHIILFADASDSEEPGKYKELLEKCVKAGITCSVIALGTEHDCDAELLKDIAARGQGRCFFTEKAEELPRLFTQDTFSVARNTFLEDPVAVSFTPLLESITGQAFSPPPELGGYNLTYLQPQSQLEGVSEDEYSAPVVATRYVGLGRSACFTGQVDGQFSGDFGAWERLDAFYTSLVRWTAGEQSSLPPELLLTQRVSNGVCQIRLHLPEESEQGALANSDKKTESNSDGSLPWTRLFLNNKPCVSVVRSVPETGSVREDPISSLKWIDGCTLGADVPIRGEERILASVVFPDNASISEQNQNNTNEQKESIQKDAASQQNLTVTLPPACRLYSPEYNPASRQSRNGETVLRRLADLTGGKERADIASLWQDITPGSRLTPIFPFLLCCSICVFLLEILERRTGVIGAALLTLYTALFRRKRVSKESARNTAATGKGKTNSEEEKPDSISPGKEASFKTTASEIAPDVSDSNKSEKKKEESKRSSAAALGDVLKKAKKRADKRNE